MEEDLEKTDEDEIDEEEIWENMLEFAAARAGISVAQVRAIADEAGLHAYGHAGIVELVDLVLLKGGEGNG
jgi:hypothetical protein